MPDRAQLSVSPGRSRSPAEAGRRPGRPTFVGRAAELQQMMRMLAAARRGEPQLALVHGPAGIGKTRLAQEVAARARRRGFRVGIGCCWPDGEAPPLWPWRAILRDLGAPDTILEEGPALHDRFARFLAVHDFLRSASRKQTPAVVVDDAHLADPATLLLVRFLSRVRDLPLLVMLTRRDEAPAPDGASREVLAELDREAVAIPLEGLTEDAVGAYLGSRVAVRPERHLLQAVASITRGNPLHLRSIATQGQLRAGGVRGGLERAIRDVLDELPADDRRLVSLGALVGSEVSAHEVARVANVSPAGAAEALRRAVHKGLAWELSPGHFGFVHDLVRLVALGALPDADRLEGHARAARLLAGREPGNVTRRAHHALSAATRSEEDARTAVSLARTAAEALRREDGFEAAAALLGKAAEIHAAAALQTPLAALAVEHAENVLACGRLAEARPLFQHAARMAEREGDALVLARAALGLGGVWVSEHRAAGEQERVSVLQRRALDRLPAGEAVLRARLVVRLAAEAAYRGGPQGDVLEAVERVRRTGDAHALAEALSLAHHALLTPADAARRLPMAREIIAAAAAAGDGLLSLVGLCWQTVDLFLLGDPGAEAALAELRRRADALRCLGILFIARAMEVMLAIREGAFERAQQEAAAVFALGLEAGDADALSYRGAHLSAIRYFQGREHELADLTAEIASSPSLLHERERTFSAAAALFALRAGQPQPGRALLARLSRDGIASIPQSSSWLTTMLAVVELASAFGEARLAQAAYDALLPYAERPLLASLAVVCLGSVHRPLGLAAQACGKLDLAIEHFAAALAANEQLGHRPAAIQTRAELALARLSRAGRRHDPRGRALLENALAEAEGAGMTALAERWRLADASLGPGAARDAPAACFMTLVQGGKWRVVLGEHVATVRDRVGMRHLARLVSAPDREIPSLALVVDGAAPAPPSSSDALLDRKAMVAIRDRIRELHDRTRRTREEQDELVTLTRELARATGLGGRTRSFADAPERARTAVRKAVRRAIEEILAANPTVGRHLERRIETGASCTYRLEGLPVHGAD